MLVIALMHLEIPIQDDETDDLSFISDPLQETVQLDEASLAEFNCVII